MTTVARARRKVNKDLFPNPAIRVAPIDLEKVTRGMSMEAYERSLGELWDITVNPQLFATLIVALERLESDVEELGVEHIEREDLPGGGLLDKHEIHEWIRRLQA